MRARRRFPAGGLAAIAAAGSLALAGCSSPATPSGAGQAATGPGARLWASHFAGPGHVGDRAKAVAIGPDGMTVFVTGTFVLTSSPILREQYGTIGYAAATGRRLWVSRYGGAGDADVAAAIAVSPGGRAVFVTGESVRPVTNHSSASAYATVAYDAVTGRQLWASRSTGHGAGNELAAKAITVSPDGRTVFVTGEGPSGYLTIAYSAATGKQEWATSQDGGLWANAIAVSPDGRTLFVTGDAGRYVTIAYDARTGAQRWVSIAGSAGDTSPSAVSVSPDGQTVFVTGMTNDSFGTVAYNAANGARRWASRWHAPFGYQDAATAMAISPGGGTVYVAGYAGTDGDRRPKIVTLSYSARTGARLWVREYQAPGMCRNIAASIAVGAGGRTVFVGGSSTIPEPAGRRPCDAGLDTIAYRAATGKQLWLERARAAAAFAGGVAVGRLTDTVVITGGVRPRPRAGEHYATVAYRG